MSRLCKTPLPPVDRAPNQAARSPTASAPPRLGPSAGDNATWTEEPYRPPAGSPAEQLRGPEIGGGATWAEERHRPAGAASSAARSIGPRPDSAGAGETLLSDGSDE